MLSIDEAIAKYKEITNTDANCPAHCNISCDKCVQESKQLVEWLEELKMYKSLTPRELVSQKQKNDRAIEYSRGFNYGFNTGYNKAIDDFAEKATKIVYESNNREINPQPRDMIADIHYKLLEIAEQLKAGGENEQSI